jgi:hypothetical protein
MSEKLTQTQTQTEANLFNQVDQQLSKGNTASVLVERSDGTISTGQVVRMGEGRSGVFFEGNKGKIVGNEKLTDKYQEGLARELAGVALRGDEAVSPVDYSDINTELGLLRRGAETARDEIARAQREGRGNDSRYWQEQLGQYNRDIEGLQAGQNQTPVDYTDILNGNSQN